MAWGLVLRRVGLAVTLAWAGAASMQANTAKAQPATAEPATPVPPSTPTPLGAFEPGRAVFGPSGQVEYIPGTAPVIVTAPHGGLRMPDTLPDRSASVCGMRVTTVHDTHTADLARAIQARYAAAHGSLPHVVIMHLHRRKIDANRPEPEATCGHPLAQAALQDWHALIEAAKAAVVQRHGRGLLIDVHGHGRPRARLELGYLVTAEALDQADGPLDAAADVELQSSIAQLSVQSPLSFSELLRGPRSLGALYEAQGVSAIPSPAHPSPQGQPYFTGGYNTLRHGCGRGAAPVPAPGLICAVQIETHFRGVRDTPQNWERFGDITAQVLAEFLRTHWGLPAR